MKQVAFLFSLGKVSDASLDGRIQRIVRRANPRFVPTHIGSGQ
jgi:hypothetical protein